MGYEQVLPVEKLDRDYGGKPSFLFGALPVADCTIAWTRMPVEEPTLGGPVKFHTTHKLTREASTGLLRAMAHSPS